MADKNEAFRAATDLLKAEAELFGLTREEVAKSSLVQSLFDHLDVHGKDKTIALLHRFIRVVELDG